MDAEWSFVAVKSSVAGPEGDRVTVSSEGSVGIGTTAPRGKLDLRGDLHVDGTIYVNGRPIMLGACE